MYKSQLVYRYLPFSSGAVEQEMARRRIVMELIQRSVNQVNPNVEELFRRLMRIEPSKFSYNGQDRSAAYRY